MSQAGSGRITSGSLPSDVPTQFTADNGGLAIPANHNLFVEGGFTDDNNNNGIETTAAGTDHLIIGLTNRSVVEDVTQDGDQNVSSIILLPPSPGAITFRVMVTGYDAVNDEMTGGMIVGVARSTGNVVTIIQSDDVFAQSDAGLVAASWDMDTNLILQQYLYINFIGVAGRTITWKALLEYIQVTP